MQSNHPWLDNNDDIYENELRDRGSKGSRLGQSPSGTNHTQTRNNSKSVIEEVAGKKEDDDINVHGPAIQRVSFVKKLGKLAIFMLVFGIVVSLGAVGFVGFLWFGNSSNRIWHSIIVHNWLVKAATIASEAIKQAVTFQIGICSAMLAAIALERYEVPLSKSAQFSMMRAGSGSGQLLSLSKTRFHLRHFRTKEIGLSVLILFSTMILGLIQATTIVLISDIGLTSTPGKAISVGIPIGMTYQTTNTDASPRNEVLPRYTTWLSKPPFYPTFAEYSEAPFIADGVSDTGVTLRAFLPFAASQDRQSIQSYTGKTTVLDSRVTCQVPELDGETLQMSSDSYAMTLTGSVSATRNTPRLGNFTLKLEHPTDSEAAWIDVYNTSVPFRCLIPTTNLGELNTVPDQWRITLCQLGEGGLNATTSISGGLVSEFKPLDSSPAPGNFSQYFESSFSYGTAYLALNVTLGSGYTWRAITDEPSPVAPPAYSENGEWLDLVYSNGGLILGVTLCYSAFDTADIPVLISSKTNRTEATTSFDFTNARYQFGAVRNQLGQETGQTLEERGVLQLKKSPSWIANSSELPPVEPFMRDFANMAGPGGEGNNPNYTATLWQTTDLPNNQDTSWLEPDDNHLWLFQEIMSTGGSVAFGLQSMITILASMAYYDQFAQFDNTQIVEIVSFVTVNIRQHYWCFVAVCTVLTIHLILVVVIVTTFANGSRFSMLGNTWQSIAQIVTGETRNYLDIASMRTDDDIADKIKGDGKEESLVHVRQVGTSQRVGVTALAGISTRPNGNHSEAGKTTV